MNLFTFFKKKGIDTINSSFYSKIVEWKRWYEGDVPKFHHYKVYRGNGSSVKCTRLSLGMAKKLAEDIANLLLNEKVVIKIEDKATDEFVAKVLKANHFDVQGNEYQERKAATGTVAYVPYLRDIQVVPETGAIIPGTGKIAIDYIEATNIFPTSWENGEIKECVFTFPKIYKQKKYVHFQYHHLEETENGQRYVIENMVVEESTSNSGRELTPTEWNKIPTFKGLATKITTDSDKPQFVIDRLNIVNNADTDVSNPMGIAVYANAIPTLKKIDLEYDSYSNEFTLGRKRIFVAPEVLVSKDGNPVFDPEDSVFYELPEDYWGEDKKAIQEVNMELRVEEHSKAINDDLNYLSFKCGFGTDRYRFEGGQLKTATEVISQNSDMYRNLKKHELILGDVLRELVDIIVRLGIQIGEPLNPESEVTINFDDSIIEDSESEMNNDFRMMAAGVISQAEFRAKWRGETLEQAQQNVPQQTTEVIM